VQHLHGKNRGKRGRRVYDRGGLVQSKKTSSSGLGSQCRRLGGFGSVPPLSGSASCRDVHRGSRRRGDRYGVHTPLFSGPASGDPRMARYAGLFCGRSLLDEGVQGVSDQASASPSLLFVEGRTGDGAATLFPGCKIARRSRHAQHVNSAGGSWALATITMPPPFANPSRGARVRPRGT